MVTVMRSFHSERENVGRIVRDAMFALSAIISLASGFVIGSSNALLSAWLGSGSVAQSDILVVATISVPLGVAAAPLYALCLASGRVLVPGLAICVAGVLYIAAFALLERAGGVGPLELAVICGSFYVGHLLLVSLPYASRRIEAPMREFAAPLFSLIAWTAVAAALSKFAVSAIEPTNFVALALCGIVISPVYIALVLATLPQGTRERRSSMRCVTSASASVGSARRPRAAWLPALVPHRMGCVPACL